MRQAASLTLSRIRAFGFPARDPASLRLLCKLRDTLLALTRFRLACHPKIEECTEGGWRKWGDSNPKYAGLQNTAFRVRRDQLGSATSLCLKLIIKVTFINPFFQFGTF